MHSKGQIVKQISSTEKVTYTFTLQSLNTMSFFQRNITLFSSKFYMCRGRNLHLQQAYTAHIFLVYKYHY